MTVTQRVLVCGGRALGDYSLVLDTLARLSPAPTVIIHGDARAPTALSGSG